MEHYAAIDVSLELSSVCIVDAKGKIVRETRVAGYSLGTIAVVGLSQSLIYLARTWSPF